MNAEQQTVNKESSAISGGSPTRHSGASADGPQATALAGDNSNADVDNETATKSPGLIGDVEGGARTSATEQPEKSSQMYTQRKEPEAEVAADVAPTSGGGDSAEAAHVKTADSDRRPAAAEQQHQSSTEASSTEAMRSSRSVSAGTGDDSMSPSAQTPPPPQVRVGGCAGATAVAAIPENILSPPKSETQTDETNTATSSSSPGSDSQLSPIAEQSPEGAPPPDTPDICLKSAAAAAQQRPINVLVNGTIPKSGKPLMAAMNKKLNAKSSAVRPRKPKAMVAMYESEISDNKIGIKLCIKKSDTSPTAATPPPPPAANNNTAPAVAASAAVAKTPIPTATPTATPPSSSKPNRKRSRKSKAKARPRIDSDDSEYEVRKKKERAPSSNAGGERQKKVSFSGVAAAAGEDPQQDVQTAWGARLPDEILCQIFQLAVEREGCLPTLPRLGRVSSLWRRVSLTSSLWRTLDLSTWIKEKYRTEAKLKWFLENRCSCCTELNVSNWKVTDINCFLTKLAVGCPALESITLSGWKNFTTENLAFLVENMKKLQRLDLSSINLEMNTSRSAVGLQSLCNALQIMNGRLTHLYLAHNRLAGIPQIVNILSTHCPNLVLFDLSNVTTQATSHGILHIEKLQRGCPKLRVLRVTNSHITPSTASMQETMDSPGFPNLEELSVAVVNDESRVIGDEHVQRILKTSSKLKLLDVRGCTRLTHESLIRLPAWDIKHLFLSGCSVTRDVGAGLELIASKWAHSLIELDLAWANVQQPLDNALRSLAEKGSDSPLAHLNLCGSSVSEEAVKEILANCALMSSINLSSCRGLPRGVKRLMQGPKELQELRDVLKVQPKFKLPAQLQREREEAQVKTDDADHLAADVAGSGGGGRGCVGAGGSSGSGTGSADGSGDSSGKSQCN